MMVGGRRVSQNLAAGITRHHHRNLGFEIESLLCHAGLLSQGPPCLTRIRSSLEFHLAPSVVAALGPFEIDPAAQLLDRLHQIPFGINRPVSSDRKAAIAQPVFLPDAVLHHGQEVSARTHRGMPCRGIQRGQRNLLNLERDHIASASQIGSRLGVIPGTHEAGVHHKAGGAGRVGIHHLHPVAHRAGSHGGHAPQLSAAQDANGRALDDGAHSGNSASRTSRLRACRQERSRWPSPGS